MSNLAKDGIDKIKNLGNKTLNKLVNQPNNIFFSIILSILSAFVVFIIIFYIILQITKKKDNMKYIEKKYKKYKLNTKAQTLLPIEQSPNDNYKPIDKDGKSRGRLCDYFITSSYNSCCSGDFKDDYVDIEALKNVIKQGARVLDFQIFSINDEIIVSASNNETEFIKGTYNYLYLNGYDGILSVIEKYAFNKSTCSNFSDPLFINLRIQTEKNIYDSLTQMFKTTFKGRLLESMYGYEGEKSGMDIRNTNILDFKNKIIIMCDQENKNYKNTSFHEFINLSPNNDSGFLMKYKNYQINFSEEKSHIKEKSKRNLIAVYPNNTYTNDNKSPKKMFDSGCSIIFMNYQKLDKNLIDYLNTFGSPQEYNSLFFYPSAFLLKPENLRENVKLIKSTEKPSVNYNIDNIIIEIQDNNNKLCYRNIASRQDLYLSAFNNLIGEKKEVKIKACNINGNCDNVVNMFDGSKYEANEQIGNCLNNTYLDDRIINNEGLLDDLLVEPIKEYRDEYNEEYENNNLDSSGNLSFWGKYISNKNWKRFEL